MPWTPREAAKHNRSVKSPKRKRHLGQDAMISDHDAPRIKKMLGVGK